MILNRQVNTVLSGNPGPSGVYEVLDGVLEDGRKLSAEKNQRAAEAKKRLEAIHSVSPEEALVEQVETPQITALKGSFHDFMQSNPSQKMIGAWIKTHRVD